MIPTVHPSRSLPWSCSRILAGAVLCAGLSVSTSQAASPFSINLTGDAAGKTITVASFNGAFDSLVVTHREPTALSEAITGIVEGQAALKSRGAALVSKTSGSLQSFSVPEGGVYWVYAKRATSVGAEPESTWAAGRIEFAPVEGRLSTWYDASGKALYIKIVVPSTLSLASNVAVTVIPQGATSAVAPLYEGEVNKIASTVTVSVNTAATGAITAWLRVPQAFAPDSVNVVFPATVAGAKPILLHASRPNRDANLESVSHLIERIETETGNPLVKASTPTLTSANQLHYWSALVDSVPTWNGYTELLRALLTAKKGAATSWSDAISELSNQTVVDSLRASMTRPVVARKTQQNLTGPVYYGAYTRATLDNDLHFPLAEGELLQILWQGSIDLYYMEPAATVGKPGILTKLALPAPPTGTTAPDPYLTTKQLVLAQGSPLLTKIQDSGLWVKGVRMDAQSLFSLKVGAVANVPGAVASDLVGSSTIVDETLFESVYDVPYDIRLKLFDDEKPAVLRDTFSLIDCRPAEILISLKEDQNPHLFHNESELSGTTADGRVNFSLVTPFACADDTIAVAKINLTFGQGRDMIARSTLEFAQLSGDIDEAEQRIKAKYPGLLVERFSGDENHDILLDEDSEDGAALYGGSSPSGSGSGTDAKVVVTCPDFSSVDAESKNAPYLIIRPSEELPGWQPPAGAGRMTLTQLTYPNARVLSRINLDAARTRKGFYSVSNSPLCIGVKEAQILAISIDPLTDGDITYFQQGLRETPYSYSLNKSASFRKTIEDLVARDAYDGYAEHMVSTYDGKLWSPVGDIVTKPDGPFPVVLSCRNADVCKVKVRVQAKYANSKGSNIGAGVHIVDNEITILSGSTYGAGYATDWARMQTAFVGLDQTLNTNLVALDAGLINRFQDAYNPSGMIVDEVEHDVEWMRRPYAEAGYLAATWAKKQTANKGGEFGGALIELKGRVALFGMEGHAEKVKFDVKSNEFPKLGIFRGSVHSHPVNGAVDPNTGVKKPACANLSFSTPWTNGQWVKANTQPLLPPDRDGRGGDYATIAWDRYFFSDDVERMEFLGTPTLAGFSKSGKIIAVNSKDVAKEMECYAKDHAPCTGDGDGRAKLVAFYLMNTGKADEADGKVPRNTCGDSWPYPSYP